MTRWFAETFAGALAAASFFSNSAIGMAPGTRSPSSKKIVGVPVMRLLLPYSRTLSRVAVAQLVSAGTAMSRTM